MPKKRKLGQKKTNLVRASIIRLLDDIEFATQEEIGLHLWEDEPSFSVTKKSKPVVKVVSFADGFEQRLGFGLPNNQDPKIFNLKWENITEEESDTIEYFLEERARDKASFTYSPPKESFTKTGTYSQSSTTITITITDHRLLKFVN